MESLTKQERRILHLLAQKMYQREIADQLFVSPETVKTHVKHLYRKLDARNRHQAIAHATEMGLLPNA